MEIGIFIVNMLELSIAMVSETSTLLLHIDEDIWFFRRCNIAILL